MVEEVDINNLYIAVSSPNLNLNISRTLQLGSEANGDERFYSFSQEVEVQVMCLFNCPFTQLSMWFLLSCFHQ